MIGKMIEGWRRNRELRNERRRAWRLRARPCLETMEERLVPSRNLDWKGGISADMTVAGNWIDEATNGGALLKPGASDSVYFGDSSSGTQLTTTNTAPSGALAYALCKVGRDWNWTITCTGTWGSYAASTLIFNSGNTNGIIQVNGTINGTLQWYSGKFTGTGTINDTGTSVSQIGSGSFTSFDLECSAALNIGTSGHTVGCYLDSFSSGYNLKLNGGANITVGRDSVFQLSQNGNNATSGGIKTDGSSSFISVDGTLVRELVTRSSNDNPDVTSIVLAPYVKVNATGVLTVGDSLGLKVTGHDSNNYNVINNDFVYMYGGSKLELGNGYSQGAGGALSILAPPYNAANKTVYLGGSGVKFDFSGGKINEMGFTSKNNTQVFDELDLDGDVTIKTTAHLIVNCGVNVGSSGTRDYLHITGGFTENTFAIFTMNVYEGGTLGAGSWKMMDYASIEQDASSSFGWYLLDGTAGTALTTTWTGDSTHAGSLTLSH